MQGKAILFSEMTPEPAWADRFNEWYDQEHIPNRKGLPGFLSARRYQDVDSASCLAVYEMDEPGALTTPGYKAVKDHPSETTAWMLGHVQGFTRYTCQQISRVSAQPDEALDAPVLYAVWFDVPEERAADFDEWYEQDHVPLLMQCKDWLMVRRFKVLSGDPGRYTRLALHYLRDVSALESPERAQARATPWRAKLAAEPWFKGDYRVFRVSRPRQDLR